VPAAAATSTPAVYDIRDFASPFQLEILADGQVTETEYLRAVEANITCLESKGYAVDRIPGVDAARRLQWTYRQRPLGADTPASTPTLVPGWGADPPPGYGVSADSPSWCNHQYLFVVDVTWYRQNQPTPEYKAAVREAFVQCLAERGYHVDAGVAAPGGVPVGAPGALELIQAGEGRRSFDQCAARVRHEWGMALFGNTNYGASGLDDPDTPEDERLERLPDTLPAVR
jgi:hypothetical protein